MEPSECLYLNPAQIHYSQDTISATFHDGTPLGKTLDRLVTMETFVTDIPPITVVKYKDKYFARNNRRLWVFRQLSLMGQCEYIPTILSSELPSGQFTTDTDGHEVLVRGDDGSVTLRECEKLRRDNTVQTLKSMRLCPVTPSYRCNVTPRFKGHRKQCIRKQQRHVGAKRNILRGKGRGRLSRDVNQVPGSNDDGHKETLEPGLRESMAFDFGPYATNPARIVFTEQRDMVFGNGAGNWARKGTSIGHQQQQHRQPELEQFGVESGLPGYRADANRNTKRQRIALTERRDLVYGQEMENGRASGYKQSQLAHFGTELRYMNSANRNAVNPMTHDTNRLGNHDHMSTRTGQFGKRPTTDWTVRHHPHLHQNVPRESLANWQTRNEQYTGQDLCVRGGMPHIQRGLMIGGTRAHAHIENEHDGIHTRGARRFGMNEYNTQRYGGCGTGAHWRMTDGPRGQWSAETRPTANVMHRYQVHPKWAAERMNFESLSKLRVYGQTQQAEDFAFNRFDSRH